MSRGRTSRRQGAREPRVEPLEPRLLLDGGPVVINEIHYAPDVKTEPAAFIELYNPGAASVDLAGWKFTDGVLFEFPGGTSIASHGYLVVAQDPATVLSKFGAAAIGPWSGDLSDQGEKIVLRDAANNVADEVDYGLGFPWPTVGDPPGYSIELVNPSLDNDLGGSWRRSCPEAAVQPTMLLAAGSSWRYFKGTAEPSSPISAWRQPGFNDSAWPLKPAPIGYGESLVKTGTGSGYSTLYLRTTFNVGNPAQVNTLQLAALYDDGFNVWINGTLALTVDSPSDDPAYTAYALQPGGSTQFETFTLKHPAAYLVAGANTIAVQLLNVTARSNDAFFDGQLLAWPTAAHPTPGVQNAAYAANNPPQVRQVDANPGQPSSDQPVRVTAKVTDPDGVASVILEYQLVDPGAYIAVDDAAYATGWTSVAMNDAGAGGDAEAGDGTYTVTLPGSLQTNRRLVRYRITAADALGASIRTPYADDPQPNFAYFVYDGVPAWTGAIDPDSNDPALAQVVTYDSSVMSSLPIYHLLTTNTSVVNSTWGGPTGSAEYNGDLYKWSGTLVYDGVVYDNIHYRARGGTWRYAMGKNMWKLDFNRGHEFQARDDYGNKYDTKWTKLNLGACIQQGNYWHRGEQGMFESVGSRLFNLAGVAAFQTNFVQLRIIDDASEYSTQYDGDFWGLYLAIEQEDGRFLDEHDLPDGNLYKMDGGDYDVLPDSNGDGIPDGGGGTLNNQGPTQPGDNSDLLAFVSAYSGATTDQWWRDNLNLESYYSYRSIVEAIHHGDIGYGKNYFYYHDPVTDKWQVMPWDLDLTWADNMYGNGNEPFKGRVLSRAVFAIEYKNRMREIRDLLYNTDQAYQLIDEQAAFIDDPGGGLSIVDADRALWDYNPVMINSAYVKLDKAGQGRFYAGNPPGIVIPEPGGFQGMVQKMKDYVVSRGAWIDANIIADASIPATPTVAYVGPSGSPLNRLAFRSSAYSGTNPFAAIEWRIAEVTDPANPNYDPADPKQYEINAAWQSGEITTFAADQTIPAAALQEGRTYRVRVRMKDATGRWSHWSDPVQFVAGDPLPDPLQSLRITELMYHPPDASLTGPEAGHGWVDDDFQFVELVNTGAQTLALAGVEFSEGIRFQFPAMDLAPGGRVLVVKNQAAFQARYGHACDALIVGEFADGSTLSKGGEQVVLYSPAAGAILDFEYKDGWYPRTDGEEFSLVVRSAAQDRALWDQGEGWRASWRAGGSPGTDEPAQAEDPGAVLINELLAHQDEPTAEDWIELYNTTDHAIDLGGWYLSDSDATPQDLKKYCIPAGTVIPAYGYLVLTETAHFGQAFSDSSWSAGTGGVGYDLDGTYNPYISTNVDAVLHKHNTSIYLRTAFDVADPSALATLTLRVRYDDGFVAYLNGTEIARRNAPALRPWNAAATAEHPDEQAVVLEDIDVTAYLGSLKNGPNLLAIHGLNTAAADRDFLLSAELVSGATPLVGPGAALRYLVPTDDSAGLAWTGGQFALSELGDTVILTSPGSPSVADPTTLVAGGYREDETFGATDRGVTLGRHIKSTGGKDFVAMSAPTRGGDNAYPAVGEIRAGGALVNPGVVINEILYAPLSGDDEFIELYNLTGADVPLYDPDHPANTWKFTAGITFTFPEGATIPAGGYALVVPMTEAAFRAKYPGVPGDVRVFGPSFGVLDDDGESVELSRPGTPEPGGTVPYYRVDRVKYDSEAPWVAWATGGGPSLSRLAAADYGNDAANWAAGQSGGTPGALNTFMDATPPSVPAAVAAVPAGAARIDVAWAPAFDDESGVGGYNVYRDGVQVGSSPTTSFSDTAVLPAITYTYRVAAVNGDGVESGQSAPSPEVRIVALSEASAPTATTVKATFSEMVGRDSAQEAANYQVTYGAGQSLAVASAILLPDRRSVLLTVAPAMASGTSYTVTATGIWSQAGFVLAVAQATSGMFTYTYTPPPTPPTYVLREYWTGITGTSVSNLTSSPDYPYNPGGTSDVTGGYFEAPTSFADNYGTRMRAVLTAPVTGNYTFYIASDDSSELWLNSGGQTESGRTLIASVSGYTSSRQWTKFTSQQSAAIYLQAGSHYYIEALQKDGTGSDNLAVTWVLPGGTFSSSQPPIATTYLSAYVPAPGYTVNVEATDWGAAEAGPDKGAFALSRTGPTTQSLAVYYSITGTARTGDVGEDLTGTAVIPAGHSSVAIDVTPVDDDLNEPDETVVLTILDGDPVYAIGGQASATVTIVDNELPTVTAVRLNGRVGRGVSGVDPSGAGVRTLEVDFSEPVTFTPDDVTVQAVDLTTGESRDIMPVSVLPLGDARLVITLPDDAALDTWVKVTLSGSGTLLDLTGRHLDGEARPGGSGRGYLYSAMTDLPTGDGVPGGDAVFFVGSLRGDFSGDRTISEADKVGFTLAWRSSDPDADFRGVGFGARPPDGRITIADINGFTSVYQAGLAAGRHLDELPQTLGGSGAATGVTELPALAPAGGVDVLAAAAGQILPVQSSAATAAGESDSETDDLQVRPAPAAPAGDAGASAVLRIYSS